MLKIRKLKHFVVDTSQHYSESVSGNIIRDLKLKIDYQIRNPMGSEIIFICETSKKLEKILEKEKPDIVIVIGDTNSTFCGSLASYKMGIPLAHIESGMRCGDISVPEEINRLFADSVSTWKFCSSYDAVENLKSKEGIYTGDLEYELLNNMNPSISRGDFGVMTVHRQSNCNLERLKCIMDFCKNTENKIIFPVHHRIKQYISQIKIPKNLDLIPPVSYTEMVNLLSCAKFIITDSGSIQKTSGFFGKPTIVVRKNTEWVETEEVGIVKKFDDFRPCELREWIFNSKIKRITDLYINEGSPSRIIINTILGEEKDECPSF